MTTIARTLEENGRGSGMERADSCNAEEWSEWEYRELGVEVESQQEGEDQAGAGDLLPEMDRAESLRPWPSPPPCLLGIAMRRRTTYGEPVLSGVEGPVLRGVEGPVLSGVEGVRRTRKQDPEKPAEGAGIAMIVRVGDQEQEPDGQQDECRCHTTSGDASVTSPTSDHLP